MGSEGFEEEQFHTTISIEKIPSNSSLVGIKYDLKQLASQCNYF